MVVIQEGRLYREGTFEEIFGNVHQHEVYHLLLDKSAESVLKQRFPELDYKVLDDGISVETRNPDLYRLLLEETEVLQFTRESILTASKILLSCLSCFLLGIFLATVSPIQPILSRMRLQTAPLST